MKDYDAGQVKAGLTVKEAAAEISVGKNTMYELVRQPCFPKIKVNARLIIPRREFLEWLQKNIGAEIVLKKRDE